MDRLVPCNGTNATQSHSMSADGEIPTKVETPIEPS